MKRHYLRLSIMVVVLSSGACSNPGLPAPGPSPTPPSPAPVNHAPTTGAVQVSPSSSGLAICGPDRVCARPARRD